MLLQTLLTTLALTATTLSKPTPSTHNSLTTRQQDPANNIDSLEIFTSTSGSYIQFHYSDSSPRTSQETKCRNSTPGSQSLIDPASTNDALGGAYIPCDGPAAFSLRNDGVVWIQTSYIDPSDDPQFPDRTCTFWVAYTVPLETVQNDEFGVLQINSAAAFANGNASAVC